MPEPVAPAKMPAPQTETSGQDPTRALAFALLGAVLERRRTLDRALESLPEAAGRDRAAAHRLAATVLRRAGTLDAALEPWLRREPPVPVRTLLRMGAAQALFLGVPPHAAVGTIVALARAAGLAPFAGLANAVLRRVAAAGPQALEGLDGPRLDTPAWLWASWGARARAIAAAHAEEAPLDLTLRPGAAVPSGGVLLPTGSVRFPAGTRVEAVPGWADGEAWVQDAAAALPARLLTPRPGERVADLCAAPGGKTAQLAAAGAEVVAVERDPARARVLEANLARLRLPARVVVADMADWAETAEPFDAVLLDAPCSATGTIRRHPDVPHLRRPADVAEAARRQSSLLARAARLVRPGGRLIYAVCSLQPEEGEAVLAALAGSGLRRAPFSAEELAGVGTEAGWLRTDPGMGMDGFFAARFVRDR